MWCECQYIWSEIWSENFHVAIHVRGEMRFKMPIIDPYANDMKLNYGMRLRFQIIFVIVIE